MIIAIKGQRGIFTKRNRQDFGMHLTLETDAMNRLFFNDVLLLKARDAMAIISFGIPQQNETTNSFLTLSRKPGYKVMVDDKGRERRIFYPAMTIPAGRFTSFSMNNLYLIELPFVEWCTHSRRAGLEKLREWIVSSKLTTLVELQRLFVSAEVQPLC